MEAEYRRETTGVYMIIKKEPGFSDGGYEERTIGENHIPGLLKMRTESIDGQKYYKYDISDLKPFRGYCRMMRFGQQEVKKLLLEILSSIVRFEDYLLDADHLLLDPEFLYAAPDGRKIEMAYVPFYREDFRVQLRRLLEFIMIQVGSSEHDAVVFICRIMHELGEVNAEPGSLLAIVMNDGKRPEDADLVPANNSDALLQGGVCRENMAGALPGEFGDDSHRMMGDRENEDGAGTAQGSFGYGAEKPGGKESGKKRSRAKKMRAGKGHGAEKQASEEAYTGMGQKPGKVSGFGMNDTDGNDAPTGRRLPGEKARALAPEKETWIIAAAGIGAAVLVYLGLHFYGFAAHGIRAMAAVSAAAGAAVLLIALMIRKMQKRCSIGEEEDRDDPAPAFPCAGDFMPGERNSGNSFGRKPPIKRDVPWGHAEESGMLAAGFCVGESGNMNAEARDETILLYGAGSLRRDGPAAGDAACLRPDPPNDALPVIRLDDDDILIGKQANSADAVIPEKTVSRIHARIVRKNGKYYISDLGSRNGTSVDGEQLAGGHEIELKNGAHVTFAACSYVFVA